MRISDWSSDVCSSDLVKRRVPDPKQRGAPNFLRSADYGLDGVVMRPQRIIIEEDLRTRRALRGSARHRQTRGDPESTVDQDQLGKNREAIQMRGSGERSEEHTSKLQSLMRISYAAFCLKQ